MSPPTFTLTIKEGNYTVLYLDPDQPLPVWALSAPGFLSMTCTNEEVSIVCSETCNIPADVKQVRGWRCLKFEFKTGEKNLSMSGVISSLAGPLAAAKISIFVISTFMTDYVLVKGEDLRRAVDILQSVE